ncbi:MAG: glycosyltransferase [Candidatus Paceibacterota bacterium]
MEDKKKILIIVTLAEVGGAQMSVLNLSRELKRRGNEVTVGFGKGDFLAKECERAGIGTRRFHNLDRSHNILKNLKFILELRSFLKNENFDVVHINSSNALVGALATVFLSSKKPQVVFTYRGLSFLDEHNEDKKVKKLFYRIIFRFLTLFVNVEVFVSKANLKSAQRMGLGKKGVVIYNGLDLSKIDFLEREKARSELERLCGRKLKNKKVVGSVGRLAYQKNYEFLIKNWLSIREEVPGAICVILGDGPDREKLEDLIDKKGCRGGLYLLGEYPNAGRLLKGFDVFTLPSRYEGLSITTLEALFAGIPMLVTKTGGNPEVVAEVDEFLFGINKNKEFKEKLVALLNDQELKDKALFLSKERSYQFTISNTTNGYEEVYRAK